MKTKTLFVALIMAILMVGSVSAAGLSIQLKRTNPGIAKEKSAELIFDVVNTDFNSKVEGFLWCRSPDDTVVSSSLGVGSGSGAQYVSEKFYMDVGPSQKAISLVLEADSPGDKRTGCTIKYAPYTEEASETETTTEAIDYEGTIGLAETDVSGYKVAMSDYKAGEETVDNETNETVFTTPASVKVTVNGIPKTVEVGGTANIGGLTVEIVAATEESAEVKVTGTLTSESGGAVQRQYIKMNGEKAKSLTDDQYREIRLDKTIPFVNAAPDAEVSCPEGKSTCNAQEVVVVGGQKIPVVWIVVGVIFILLVIAWLLGRVSSNK